MTEKASNVLSTLSRVANVISDAATSLVPTAETVKTAVAAVKTVKAAVTQNEEPTAKFLGRKFAENPKFVAFVKSVMHSPTANQLAARAIWFLVDQANPGAKRMSDDYTIVDGDEGAYAATIKTADGQELIKIAQWPRPETRNQPVDELIKRMVAEGKPSVMVLRTKEPPIEGALYDATLVGPIQSGKVSRQYGHPIPVEEHQAFAYFYEPKTQLFYELSLDNYLTVVGDESTLRATIATIDAIEKDQISRWPLGILWDNSYKTEVNEYFSDPHYLPKKIADYSKEEISEVLKKLERGAGEKLPEIKTLLKDHPLKYFFFGDGSNKTNPLPYSPTSNPLRLFVLGILESANVCRGPVTVSAIIRETNTLITELSLHRLLSCKGDALCEQNELTAFGILLQHETKHTDQMEGRFKKVNEIMVNYAAQPWYGRLPLKYSEDDLLSGLENVSFRGNLCNHVGAIDPAAEADVIARTITFVLKKIDDAHRQNKKIDDGFYLGMRRELNYYKRLWIMLRRNPVELAEISLKWLRSSQDAFVEKGDSIGLKVYQAFLEDFEARLEAQRQGQDPLKVQGERMRMLSQLAEHGLGEGHQVMDFLEAF